MIRMPLQLADREERPGASALPPGTVVDLELARENVARLGGDAARFTARCAAVDAAVGDGPFSGDPETARALVTLAAWRAGLVAMRDEALRHLETLRRRGDAERAAAAAALGLEVAQLDVFAERQASDRFFWPGRDAANGFVCAVGGFAGFGGAWTGIPDAWRALPDVPDGGAFAIHADDHWWRLDADAWGAYLTRLPDGAEPPRVPRGPGAVRGGVVLLPDSYLAWIRVGDDA
ncbi:potassium transporter Kef [Microbacterium sp. bgisy203]|uniref:potassium transporter Kef n=1 Tax=Microbacterium sp. bgisy203 TaxID=3413799 RepID=UPI003D75A08A